jgi:hypothetical protein
MEVVMVWDGGAPSLIGLRKGPNSGSGRGAPQFHGDKVNAYEDCKKQYRLWEQSGKMTEENRKFADIHLKGLKAQSDAGLIKTVDYQKEGHPLDGGKA